MLEYGFGSEDLSSPPKQAGIIFLFVSQAAPASKLTQGRFTDSSLSSRMTTLADANSSRIRSSHISPAYTCQLSEDTKIPVERPRWLRRKFTNAPATGASSWIWLMKMSDMSSEYAETRSRRNDFATARTRAGFRAIKPANVLNLRIELNVRSISCVLSMPHGLPNPSLSATKINNPGLYAAAHPPAPLQSQRDIFPVVNLVVVWQTVI